MKFDKIGSEFDRIWYGHHPLQFALVPFAWLFCATVSIRRQAYQYGLLKSHSVPVPVIVVGNITVGGTGKTPLVIWLGQFLKHHGFRPGIVSRGYGGQADQWPQSVYPDSDPHWVGDESILLARHSGCPVIIAPQRWIATQTLLKKHHCNLIISDDGLQHYALHREIEIAVLEGIRRYGNRRCLPAGPLREPLSRLKHVDFLVTKGTAQENEFPMQYEAQVLRNLTDENLLQSLQAFRDQTVHAVSGIGYPTHFFTYLRNQGLKLHCHPFPDHYNYRPVDIQFNDDLPVIMTEKDAVKCQQFAGPQHWYLPIEAHLPHSFAKRLLDRLQRIQHGQKVT